MEESRLKNIEEAISGLSQQMHQRFDQIDQRFEQVDRRFDKHDERFDQVDRRFDKHDERFDQVGKKLEDHDQKFQGVDRRFDGNSTEHAKFMKVMEDARKDREELWQLTVAEFRRFDQKFEDQGRYFEILLENFDSKYKLFGEAYLGHGERLENHEDRIARLEQSA